MYRVAACLCNKGPADRTVKNTAQLLRSAEGQKLLTELRADLAGDLMSPVGGCWGEGRNLVSRDKFVVLKLG